MKKWLPLALLLVCLCAYWLYPTKPPTPPASPPSSPASRPRPELPAGAEMLKNYASQTQTPEQDLTDMHRALSNFSLLVKGRDPLPLGANEDLTNALRGKNTAKLRFIPDAAAYLNAQGQLVDRWGSPLFFHANDKQRVDIRSAGPDRQMWTSDDLHRRYDGQFLKGDALNAASLMEATQDYGR